MESLLGCGFTIMVYRLCGKATFIKIIGVIKPASQRFLVRIRRKLFQNSILLDDCENVLVIILMYLLYS